ncbi:MAG: YfcE family phosphodiesterase [Desulfobacula sp.]|jgi:putative phosphoesterase|uniref:YfcE family phosphodiesterase n=1 Tax=Desulfobacula sp. TaxID=2593537 RepID=UPI001D78A1AD|nr:YfcE family phosphodiesterase [Desulfobacula sp.]MBT3484158.1 YfcE family phosphodiesterase [Desulfobacula sp.]MBT3803729.1 YfcE family phosphodiesterase [Desulfobacula sp.]MBT4024434.1 YfcE family phosphodiesterase [Desulfobacula sp.]MBT4198475.1 YfcE family phosphodiesterase [Desulfobacula sp.]
MKKLIVTADIHGSHSSWLTIKNLLGPLDELAIAGDLFDTKYGNFTNFDFQPESIKKDLSHFNQVFYYVYGNCDSPAFFPGFDTQIKFKAFNKSVILSHGHRSLSYSADMDIIIQGHTHLCSLEKKGGQIFMNPGSITFPRNGIHAYGVIENNSASLIELKTGNKLIVLDL